MSKRRSEEEQQAIINKIETLDPALKYSMYNLADIDAIKQALVRNDLCTEAELEDDFYEFLDKRIQ